MRVERGPLRVEVDEYGITIGRDHPEDAVSDLDTDEVRWLALVALPAVLAAIPSDPPAKVQGSAPDDGQIPGQLAIE